jgi:hypothetical protein
MPSARAARSLYAALHARHLALHRRQFFHRRPDLRGEVPQDGSLEADRPDAPRNPHPRAMRFPKEVGMLLGLQPARNGVQLLPQLLEFSEMPRGVFGHGDKFLAALFGSLVDRQRVGHQYDIARRNRAAAHLLGQVQDLLDHQRRARERFHHRILAAFDAPRDFRLAFARQQRDGAHLAQIRAYRIVDLLSGRRTQIQIQQIFGFPQLLVEFEFGIFQELDAGPIQSGQQVAEFGAVGRDRRGGLRSGLHRPHSPAPCPSPLTAAADRIYLPVPLKRPTRCETISHIVHPRLLRRAAIRLFEIVQFLRQPQCLMQISRPLRFFYPGLQRGHLGLEAGALQTAQTFHS